MQIINSILSAGLQLILFSIIPFIWWFIHFRKEEKFFKWVGLKKPAIKDNSKNIFFIIAISFVLLTLLLFAVTLFVDNTTSEFSNFGTASIIAVIITAFIRTGFAEEVFFRGFLAKRLIHKYGFQTGNRIQAILFGSVHGLEFILVGSEVLIIIIITILTAMVGYLLGFINERQFNGSIIPSWLVHSIVNSVSFIATMSG